MEPRFRLLAVSKAFRCHYPGRADFAVPALSGVSLDIEERSVHALVGVSGAGKSTLARMVMGVEKPDRGMVLYRGRSLAEAMGERFRRQNQMMFQNPYLAVNPLFTVRQVIAEPLVIAAAKPAVRADKVKEVLDLLELPEHYLERLPGELSGGELQRVVLGRAMILEPGFLVLDEPFSALDDLTAMRLLQQFKKLFLRLKLGVLFITHHPRHVRALADRVSVLDQGRILS